MFQLQGGASGRQQLTKHALKYNLKLQLHLDMASNWMKCQWWFWVGPQESWRSPCSLPAVDEGSKSWLKGPPLWVLKSWHQNTQRQTLVTNTDMKSKDMRESCKHLIVPWQTEEWEELLQLEHTRIEKERGRRKGHRQTKTHTGRPRNKIFDVSQYDSNLWPLT